MAFSGQAQRGEPLGLFGTTTLVIADRRANPEEKLLRLLKHSVTWARDSVCGR